MAWRSSAPSPARALSAATLRAAPLAVALPLLIAGIEALERRDAAALPDLLRRALEEVGPLGPLIAGAATVAGARASGAWEAWGLLGWSSWRRLAPVLAAAALLSGGLWAVQAALPAPPPAALAPRATPAPGGRWRVPGPDGPLLLDPATLSATPAPPAPAEAPPPLPLARRAWLARALALLALLPWWALPDPRAAEPSLGGPAARLLALGAAWLVLQSLLGLLVEAGALPSAAAWSALLAPPLLAGAEGLRRLLGERPGR